MKLELLILTKPERNGMLEQLVALLDAQLVPGVEVFIHPFAGTSMADLGAEREYMRRQATGDYIAFIDDDDLVAPDYVPQVMKALRKNPDQVGFEVAPHMLYYLNGMPRMRPLPRTFHTLKAEGWYETYEGMSKVVKAYWRDISHICPMRRDLALQVPISGGFGEDARWAQAMRGKVKTETYIDRVMYYYMIREPKRDLTDHDHPFRKSFLETLRDVQAVMMPR